MHIEVMKYLQLLDDDERRRLAEYARHNKKICDFTAPELKDMAGLVEKALVGAELGELDILGSKPIGLYIDPSRPE